MEDREDIDKTEYIETLEEKPLQQNEISEEEKSPQESKIEEESGESIESLKKEIEELKEKYLRIYAEFENYKKMVTKEKEEILRYSNESLINAIIPSIDNLEMALKHVTEGVNDGLVKGVEITLKEILRVFEKAGLIQIDALNKPFDPQYHEAMSVVEREDIEPMTVVEEFRKGYIYKDKVLRPSLVAVSKRPENSENKQ